MPHLHPAAPPGAYTAYMGRKRLWLAGLAALCGLLLVAAMSLGAVHVPAGEVLKVLLGGEAAPRHQVIIQGIRLPHALAAFAAGLGLSVAGAAMQSVLRNPLGSPFTLGVSQAAAFGAAFAVMVLGSGTMQSSGAGAVAVADPLLTTACAFVAALLVSGVITAVAGCRGGTPEVMVLTGVALGSLCTAGTMFLQYFASDVQLAAMVFWTFGDVSRAGWREVAALGGAGLAGALYFTANAWNYNALEAGEEIAQGLGVRLSRVRIAGMVASTLLTSVIVAALGVIGFVGLVCPHMMRRALGDDARFLLPASALAGGALLLASDTAARLILAPHALPVSILTAFLGAPTFLWLLMRRRRP